MHGVVFGLLFASAESWLGQAVPSGRRGDVMGFYYFLSRIAGLLAPFLAFGMSALTYANYLMRQVAIRN